MDYEKDFRTRKVMAWNACNKLEKIWRSDLKNEIKIQLFRSLIEPILLYGAETWTLTARLQKRLDGAYTNLLRIAQNIHWRQHATLKRIYGEKSCIWIDPDRLCGRRMMMTKGGSY